MRRNQHVVPKGKEWAIRPAGGSKVTSNHATQKGAIQKAMETAKNQRTEVVIHRPDGRIRDRDSYGNDPHPPKDRKH